MTDVSSEPATPLARTVSGKLLYVFILGDVLGAGVYALVGKMSGEVGGAVWLPLLIALGLALLTAGSYAELVTKYPRAGGAAVFAERAFKSPALSFLVGFSMLAAGVTSAASLAIAMAGEYFTIFVQLPSLLIAVVFLLLVAALNARGIKESLRANFVMTAIELSGLILVVVLAGIVFSRGDANLGRTMEFREDVAPAIAVLSAALLAFYSFVGFETSANLAEEVKDVRRTYPRALFGALLTAGGVYVAVGIAAVAVVDPETLAESTGPLLEVVHAADVVPDRLFAAVALIAVANGALLTMIMASRLTYGMASQGLLPPVLARVLPGRKTPWAAILVTTLAAIVLVFTGELQVLAETVVLLLLIVFISTNISVLVLRKDRVEEEHFQVATIIPILGTLSCLVLLTQQSPGTWLRAAVLLAIGAILHLLTRKRSAASADK